MSTYVNDWVIKAGFNSKGLCCKDWTAFFWPTVKNQCQPSDARKGKLPGTDLVMWQSTSRAKTKRNCQH